MATRTRQLRVEIVGDPRRIMRTFDSIEKSTGKMARGFSRFGTLAAAGIAGIAGGAVVAGLKSTIDAASDLNESISKSQVVFGKSNKAVQDFAKGAARSLGQSRQQALEAAATFGNLFTAMKIGQKPAADMSIKIVRLASDLASFNNVKPEEALEALRSGLVGETEPLRRFGINLNDATLRQEALALGLVKTTKEVLPPAAKAQAAYSLIMKQSATAQGDFARTAGGAANQQRIFAARIQDLKATLGQALLPTFNTVIKTINEQFIPAAERLWKQHGPKVREVFQKIAEFVGNTWAVIRDKLLPAIKDLATQLVDKMLPGLKDTAAAWRDNSAAIQDLGKDFKDLKPLWDFLLFIIHKLATEEIPGLITQIGWIGRAWQKIREPVLTVVHLLVREVLAGFGQILHGAAAAFGWVPGVGEKLKRAREAFDKFQQGVNEEFRQIISGKTISLAVRGIVSMPGAPRGTELLIEKGLRRARGGPISGPGTPTSDSIPAMLSRGEHVLSAREVAGMGGHGAVEQLRHHARGFAAGGGVTVQPGLPGAGAFGVGGARMIEQIVASTARVFTRNLVARLPGVFPPHAPGGWRVAVQFLRALGIDSNVISTFRPGARTRASGSVSYHALNRAVDLTGNMMAIFNALSRTNPTELIFSHAPRYKSRSGWHDISRLDPITFMDHLSHVHAAYDRGGWLPPGTSLATNRTGRAERVLGPGEGAGIVVNFHGPVYGDKRALTETVRQGIREALRREGKPVTV